MGGLALAGCQVPNRAALSLLLSAGQGREHMLKGSWVEISTERDRSPITIMGKTGLIWGKLIKFITNEIEVGCREIKIKP